MSQYKITREHLKSGLYPSYSEEWKEYEDVNQLSSPCKLKKWESIWYKEKERDRYHYAANTNEPRVFATESERITENPDVGDAFDITIFIFLILMVFVPYIYAICIRRKHFYVPEETPLISYHYRVGQAKIRRTTKHTDINMAELQNRAASGKSSLLSVLSYGGDGESITSIEMKNHPDIIQRGSIFMAGGIVLTSEKHTKTNEEEEPSCFCGPCYKMKKMREKKVKEISKNKVAPTDYANCANHDRDQTSSTFSSSSSSQNN